MKNIMPKFKLFYRLLTLVFSVNVIAFSQVTHAGVITNGDFSNGSTGWADASFTGQVDFDNNTANLSTGAGIGLYSAVLVQGDNGFFDFDDPIEIDAQHSQLTFVLNISEQTVDNTESGISSLNDALNLSVYDAFDPLFDIYFNSLVVTNQPQDYLLDLSSLIGRSVAFSFELNDEDDGFNTQFSLDNVQLITSVISVPEPSSMLILLFAMLVFTRKKLTMK
ncbi:PEP-CTERM sorting domain-containing protein [Colwelliaceae bacterium MEBiC 14330]